MTSLTDNPTFSLSHVSRVHSLEQQAAFHTLLIESDSFIGISSMSGQIGSNHGQVGDVPPLHLVSKLQNYSRNPASFPFSFWDQGLFVFLWDAVINHLPEVFIGMLMDVSRGYAFQVQPLLKEKKATEGTEERKEIKARRARRETQAPAPKGETAD